MRDDSTASCVVKGLNNTVAFGITESVPSYLASAALAGPIKGISFDQSISVGGNFL
ncbi:hypothetical protein [Desulfonema limicola]|uniref:hypothetical protein n=1 Tax=Desulfonema limicola TaxID=45656 RepID=UPI001FECA488|nr:hypothetical protein [Desulfonema limicola]